MSGEVIQETHAHLSESEATYKDYDSEESNQAKEEWTDVQLGSAVTIDYKNDTPYPPRPTRDTPRPNVSSLGNISYTMLEPLDILPRF